jgi:hypothetical protein
VGVFYYYKAVTQLSLIFGGGTIIFTANENDGWSTTQERRCVNLIRQRLEIGIAAINDNITNRNGGERT